VRGVMTDLTRDHVSRSAGHRLLLVRLDRSYPLASLAVKMTVCVLSFGFLVYGVSKLF
jgi:hypothetical protein